jgi:hypothetical protein
MKELDISPEIEQVFRAFRTCEFSTLAGDGTPITWPVIPLYLAQEGRFLVTAGLGLPQKAINARRNPKVALFFSDPTGSGLTNPPSVLVQGDAEVPEEIITSISEDENLDALMRKTAVRQPSGSFFSSNPLTRYLFDWYYMRLLIYITIRRVTWWKNGEAVCRINFHNSERGYLARICG